MVLGQPAITPATNVDAGDAGAPGFARTLADQIAALDGSGSVAADEFGYDGASEPAGEPAALPLGVLGSPAGVAMITQNAAPAALFGNLMANGASTVPTAAGAGGGIFGYGRAGIFNPGERARMAQIVAAARPVFTGSGVPPASVLPVNNFKDLLGGLAAEFDVPENFITAVMLAESGGDPNAVGDSGHSVGLFQLHDRGMGAGMGDDRYNPEKNARVGVAGLAGSWHTGVARGLTGEDLVRFAYDDKFNPGGGWAVQGDRVTAYWKRLEGVTDFGSSAFTPGALGWPVAGGRITQEAHTGHMALDIGVVQGTPVQAVAAGTVVSVERLETGYGWNVVVDHGGGWQTRYAHASEIYVSVGDAVAGGQTIMASGNTGKSTGPHLHFEVEYNGERQDPLAYLRPR